jgi:hypothetical protein
MLTLFLLIITGGISTGVVAGIVVGVVLGLSVIGIIIFYYASRRTVLVSNLPLQFNEKDLMSLMPGSISVNRLDSMVAAFVDFETHQMADDFVERSRKELIYFQNTTINVRWAYPSIIESCMGPPTAQYNNVQRGDQSVNPAFASPMQPKGAVRLDEETNM